MLRDVIAAADRLNARHVLIKAASGREWDRDHWRAKGFTNSAAVAERDRVELVALNAAVDRLAAAARAGLSRLIAHRALIVACHTVAGDLDTLDDDVREEYGALDQDIAETQAALAAFPPAPARPQGRA